MAEQDTVTGTEGQSEGSATQSTASTEVTALLDSLDQESASQSESATEANTEVPPEVLKAIEGLDPERLPQAFREKLEKPFKAVMTRRTQELADDKRKYEELTNKVIEGLRLARPNQAPTQEEQATIKQLIDEGKTEEALAMVRNEMRAEVAPMMSQVAMRNALDTAARLEPSLPKYEAQVAQFMQANPDIAKLAAANNFSFAPRVIQGIIADLERNQLRQELAQVKAGMADFAKKAVLADRARVAGLPSTTSRAGTTSHGEKNAGAELKLKDAMEEAARETGMFKQ